MAMEFTSGEWKFIKQEVEKAIENQRKLLEMLDKTYKEKLVATGQILAYRKVLNLPQTLQDASAAKGT